MCIGQGWYAGCQHDGDTAAAKNVPENLDDDYPCAKDYVVAGFFRWQGDVSFVYTHPLSLGGSSSSHYGGNSETYMNVGEAMGRAMVEMKSK